MTLCNRTNRAVLRLESLNDRIAPAAGALDLTFGADGKLTTPIGPDADDEDAVRQFADAGRLDPQSARKQTFVFLGKLRQRLGGLGASPLYMRARRRRASLSLPSRTCGHRGPCHRPSSRREE